MPVLVGIGDDFTGASDQAGMLARAGVRSVLVFDPTYAVAAEDWDAVTYASRLRSVPVPQARRMARALFALARDLRPHMVQYKYCSTFDSTPEGNIGPVLDVAAEACQAPGTIVVPALPVNGRTTCHGYHFVLGVPLHESPMRDHPLNPMTDASLVRWLALQTKRRVGLVSYETIERGPRAIRAALEALWSGGQPYVVMDCLSRRHARAIARAVWDLPLISGSSALPLELPAVWREQGLLGPPLKAPVPAAQRRRQRQPVLALSGSCAAQTLKQVAAASAFAVIRPDLAGLLEREPRQVAGQVAGEVRAALRDHDRVLVATSMTPPERAAFQARAAASGFDVHQLGRRIEDLLGQLAVWAVAETGLRHLLVAGGETSGAVCAALGLRAVEVLREIAPGVPLCRALPERELVVALKSGNFGQEDFFARAARMAARY
jgi:3-dehydrotetronate 4-kinase